MLKFKQKHPSQFFIDSHNDFTRQVRQVFLPLFRGKNTEAHMTEKHLSFTMSQLKLIGQETRSLGSQHLLL